MTRTSPLTVAQSGFLAPTLGQSPRTTSMRATVTSWRIRIRTFALGRNKARFLSIKRNVKIVHMYISDVSEETAGFVTPPMPTSPQISLSQEVYFYLLVFNIERWFNKKEIYDSGVL